MKNNFGSSSRQETITDPYGHELLATTMNDFPTLSLATVV